MIFVDTGAWFACVVPWDANRAAAAAWMRQNREPLITTDFVLDETLTLLRARNETPRAVALGDQLLSNVWANLYFVKTLAGVPIVAPAAFASGLNSTHASNRYFLPRPDLRPGAQRFQFPL